MKVKCIDPRGSDDTLVQGAVYDVIGESGSSYLLDGLNPSGWRKSRFEILRQVKCIDNQSSFPHLVVGNIYHVVDFNTKSYWLAEVKSHYEYYKRRFVDVVEEAPTLRSAQQPIVKQDDSNAELNFFKRKLYGNECPCGSVRGVCPDHP